MWGCTAAPEIEHLSLVIGLQGSSWCRRTSNTAGADGKDVYLGAVGAGELFCRAWGFLILALYFIEILSVLNGQLHYSGQAASSSSPIVTGVSLYINIPVFKARPSPQLRAACCII